MCGIAGVVGPDPTFHTSVGRMVPQLTHRGPDGHGTWSSPGGHCTLGHTRLAIIDLSTASAQPFVDQRTGLTLVFNGEIYNYRELRAELSGGRTFRSDGDTEVLLAAYARWGTECLGHLNGMFGFAVWDENRQTLFLARDRFGEKPLYYAQADGHVVFASELRALAQAPLAIAVDEAVALRHLGSDTVYDLDGQRDTLVDGVRQLLAGECLEISVAPDTGRPSVGTPRTYWRPTDGLDGQQPVRSLRDASAQLRDLLTDSVRLRLRSDVPVGTCLSGGLDSSSIVALVRELDPDRQIHTFTGRFPGDPVDEGRYATEMSRRAGTDYHEVEISAEGFLREAADLYRAAEFPIGSLSQYAQWCVFRLASENDVTVLLDGQGSDEIFGGYGNQILRAYTSQLLADKRFAFFLGERVRLARRVPSVFSVKSSAKQFVSSRLNLRSNRAEMMKFMSPDARAQLSASGDGGVDGGRREDPLRHLLNTLALRTMLSSLLRYGDHLSMNFSREVRLPFCDHRIIELANRLAPELLLGGGDVKRVLREAMRADLPASITAREKQGFNPPLSRWLQGPLVPWMREVVHDASPAVRGLLDVPAVDAALDRAGGGASTEWPTLWRVANLSAWDAYSYQPLALRVATPAT
ncbi:MAG: asparagine synthase (glutamine-hydrolyzing) [Acidimicrobiales bacterium]